MAFAVFSVPGGVLAARIGKKNLLMLALALSALGVLVPTLVVPGFALLLASVFVLGVGTTLLQVAGNPIMRDVSEAGLFARNLSFAQFIKGIGSVGSTALVAQARRRRAGLAQRVPGLPRAHAASALRRRGAAEGEGDAGRACRRASAAAWRCSASRRSAWRCSASSSTSAPRSA